MQLQHALAWMGEAVYIQLSFVWMGWFFILKLDAEAALLNLLAFLFPYLQEIWEVEFPFSADIYTLSFRIHLGRFCRRLGRHIDCTHSKGGICVDSVLIIPAGLKERKRSSILK
ncbi:hypothetical protein RIF29_39834 [Crotalaria pallida]|uniref:Uncharacterized protein n=1 Tax=Crotalaria pallida TaxID=3830 RepID=A0AAN9E2G0_CROPI